jgi:hypothetical protein
LKKYGIGGKDIWRRRKMGGKTGDGEGKQKERKKGKEQERRGRANVGVIKRWERGEKEEKIIKESTSEKDRKVKKGKNWTERKREIEKEKEEEKESKRGRKYRTVRCHNMLLNIFSLCI